MMIGLGTIREIPTWCGWWLVGGIAEKVSGVCDPLTREEIMSDGPEYACRNAADPAECVNRNRVLFDAQLAAAARSTPEAEQGTCEYEASQSSPALSKWFGPATVCKFRAGDYTTYIAIAAAAAVLLLLPRMGRGR